MASELLNRALAADDPSAASSERTPSDEWPTFQSTLLAQKLHELYGDSDTDLNYEKGGLKVPVERSLHAHIHYAGHHVLPGYVRMTRDVGPVQIYFEDEDYKIGYLVNCEASVYDVYFKISYYGPVVAMDLDRAEGDRLYPIQYIDTGNEG